MSTHLSLSVPPNTAENDPVETDIIVFSPILTGISVYFPDGTHNVVGVKFKDFGVAFWPPFGWFFGAGRAVEWTGRRRLTGPSYRLTVQAYSTATDWPHQLEISISTTAR